MTDPMDNLDREKQSNFRRLSTLYGTNVRTVAMTKERRGTKLGLGVAARVGVDGAVVERSPSPAFSLNSNTKSINFANFDKSQSRPSSAKVGRARAKTDFNPERPMTANETLRRLKEMKKNKKQNMEEPLFDRLARPKSAKSKFKRGPKSRTSAKDIDLKKEVHPDNEVGHPWYYGYNNTVKLPASSPFAIASRFGYRGASELVKQCSDRAQHIDIDHPKAIQIERDLVRPNEWGPSVHCEAAKAYNTHNTPKQWPKNTEFPSGAMLNEDSHTYWYNRETTLGVTVRPKSALPERLRRTLEKEKHMLIQLKSTVNKERREIAANRPKSAVARRKPAKSLYTKDEERELSQLKGNNKIKYWGEISANVKRDLRPEYAKAVLTKKNKTQELVSSMKWLLLRELYKTWRRHLSRGQPARPGLSDLHELASLFIVTSEENPMPSTISRDQFLNMLTKKVLNDSFDNRMAQKLYTCFDQRNTNRFAWVVIIASIRVLLQSYESPIQKLVGVFEIFDKYARGKMTVKNCHAPFILVALNDERLHAMKMYYNHSFKNYLKDVIFLRKKSTLELDSDGVEFCRVTKEIFQEALGRCPKIVSYFATNIEHILKLSGVQPGMEKL